jgi:hypothetical protein
MRLDKHAWNCDLVLEVCPRRQEISASDASKLASVLAVLRQCLEASDLEKRMADLEELLSPEEADNVVDFPTKKAG